MGVGYKSSNDRNGGIELSTLKFASKRSKSHSTTVFVETINTRQEFTPDISKPDDDENNKNLTADDAV